MSTDTKQATRVMNAVRFIQETDTMYGYVSATVRHVPMPDGDDATMQTNGHVVRYSPAFVATLSDADIRAVLRHEYAHVMLAHPARGQLTLMRHKAPWGTIAVAADLAVNSLLAENPDIRAGIKIFKEMLLPGRGQYADFPIGLSFDEYTALLMKKDEQDNPPPQDSDDPDSGQSDDTDSGAESDDSDSGQDEGEGDQDGDSGQDGDEGDEDGKSGGTESDDSDSGQNDSDDSGSGSGEDEKGSGDGKSESESDDSDSGDNGSGESTGEFTRTDVGRDVLPVTGNDLLPCPDDENPQVAAHLADMMTIQAVEQAQKMCGSVPGYLKRYVNDLKTPAQPDWRKVLDNLLRAQSRSRDVWHIRPRYNYSDKLLMPGRGGKSLKRCCFIIDTSGSIGAPELAIFKAVMGAMARYYPRSVIDIIQIDTEIRDTRTITPRDTAGFQFVGGGGTNLTAAFVDISQRKDAYDVVFCMTDGCFHHEITYINRAPLIWLLTRKRMKPLPGQTILVE